MAVVRERWFSRRSVSLHLAVLVFVPGCAAAAWWQINRAADGNQLSYLYSVMWPVFGLLGLYFWWMLIHTDYDSVGLKGMLRQQAAAAANRNDRGTPAASGDRCRRSTPAHQTSAGDEDPELAAYNARLAELAAQGPKTWRDPGIRRGPARAMKRLTQPRPARARSSATSSWRTSWAC